MMSVPPWKQNVDSLSSVWIDGHAEGVPSTGTPATPSGVDDAAQRYLADLLLVDALLANLSDRAANEQEQRIRRVMAALAEPTPGLPPRAGLWRWPSIAAVAACLLVTVTFLWIQLTQHSLADDVLLAVNEVSSEATDRIYALRRVLSTRDERGLPQGRLYLRGRSGFVIAWGRVVLGRNADQFWLVDPRQHVTLSHDFGWIDARATRDELAVRFMQELSLESRHIPLMQLASVAELMRCDYDVTLNRTQLDDRVCNLLIGQRRSPRDGLPATIRLWSEIDTCIILRAELGWERDNAIILELVPAEPVPDGWYGYRAHAPGEPVVRHIPPEV